MQYISLIGCKLPPLDGQVAVCLVLTVDVYAINIQQVLIILVTGPEARRSWVTAPAKTVTDPRAVLRPVISCTGSCQRRPTPAIGLCRRQLPSRLPSPTGGI